MSGSFYSRYSDLLVFSYKTVSPGEMYILNHKTRCL